MSKQRQKEDRTYTKTSNRFQPIREIIEIKQNVIKNPIHTKKFRSFAQISFLTQQ